MTASFFSEVKALVPDINKSFEDLVTFNDKLYKNKLKYLCDVREKIKKEFKSVHDQREMVTSGNQTLLTLVSNDKLDQYTQLTSELASRESEISQQKQLLKQLQNFEHEKKKIKSELDVLKMPVEKLENVYQEKVAKFNQYFTKFANRINGERPMITYVDDPSKFPINITDISGTSTGTRKSLIAAYDLAYQRFAFDENKQVPRFIVHDLIESVEGDNVRNTVNIANEISVQYIVAILKEKLNSSGFSEEEQKAQRIIELSSKKRLFDDLRGKKQH